MNLGDEELEIGSTNLDTYKEVNWT